MVKQTLLILCESVILEKENNKVSLMGLFENIISLNVPTVYPKFSVFTRFEAEKEGSHLHKIIIRNQESGEIIAELNGNINFGASKKAQYIGNFIGLPFPKFGKYKIEIYVDDAPYFSEILEVKTN